ncbi:ATP/GTP-binding protein [Propionibacterium sp.]|uniref:ATP/GTP-binding protein n=1 Tax=Propionibacterium sp. TaxID=1977903 RepID=UPI0039E77FD6
MSTKKTPKPRPLSTPSRGWIGRGRGTATMVQAPPQWRGTSVQVCGLWPFAVGSGTPMVGVPLGRHIRTGATLCCDPISWFQRAHLISNPSAFILGLPGLGKSTVARRMSLGLAGYGVSSLYLGDLKGEHVPLIRALGGQVIRLGRGRGSINVLDPGEARAAATRLTGSARAEVLADAHTRRRTMVSALITIMRGVPPTDREETIVDRALHVLDDAAVPGQVPVLGDLLTVIRQAPEPVREVALDRGSLDRYREVTENLEASLLAVSSGGRFGDMFSRPTSEPMRRDRSIVVDISGLDEGDTDLKAATLLACWSAGFATVNVAQALAQAGLEPMRHYLLVLDELWQALRAGRGMVDRVDSLTRLNRSWGVGQILLSHTMRDLMSLPDEADRMKARGFVERSGMVICGGLPHDEMRRLNDASVRLSHSEETMLESWQDPPSWDAQLGREAEPPGRGRFLVKVGGKPGIPIRVELTSAERTLNDTNVLWHQQSRVGADAQPAHREGVA